jgi:SAM-dependent methyltransferase
VPRVAQLAGLLPTDRVLDLGCGPAQLARAFAPLCAEVLAIDPEPAMLALARQQAPAHIRFRQGDSCDLAPDMGHFRIAAIGRAFHWMDRADTLARLDGLLVAGGGVVLFSTRTPDLRECAWHAAFEALLARYQADTPSRVARRGPGWVPHETVLLDSPFSRLERIAVIERRRTASASLLQRALSMSSTTRGRIGDQFDSLVRELADAVAPYAVDGTVQEVIESVALIATRP